MFGKLGIAEIIIILIVGFLIFGPNSLPKIGKSFGQTISEFKKAAKRDDDSDLLEEVKNE